MVFDFAYIHFLWDAGRQKRFMRLQFALKDFD